MLTRALVLSAVISLGLAPAAWPQSDRQQADRDFVFTDEDGHLVIRFVGIGAAALTPPQAYEVLNAEFSRMVHDHLHADLAFEAEAPDPHWAASMEPQIEKHVRHAGLEFSGVFTECRAASCRIVIEQPNHWTLPEHQAALATVQQSIEAFIETRRQQFEPVFMLTAYDQAEETSHFKAFLRRVGDPANAGPPTPDPAR